MRNTRGKRFSAFLLALAIVLTLSAPAYAEGSYAADQSYRQDRSLFCNQWPWRNKPGYRNRNCVHGQCPSRCHYSKRS